MNAQPTTTQQLELEWAKAATTTRCNDMFDTATMDCQLNFPYLAEYTSPDGILGALAPWNANLHHNLPVGAQAVSFHGEDPDLETTFLFIGTDFGPLVLAGRRHREFQFFGPQVVLNSAYWKMLSVNKLVLFEEVLFNTTDFNDMIRADLGLITPF